MTTTKLAAVRYVLGASTQIAGWYRIHHAVSADAFTAQNVHEYGDGGMGELADCIIADGRTDNLTQRDDSAALWDFINTQAA